MNTQIESRTRRSLVVALTSLGVALGCLYGIDHARAREAGALRSQIAELRARRAGEREPSRFPATTVAAVVVSAVSASVVTQAPAAGPASRPVPVPIYRNEGRSTARAALQTLAWACDQGDVAAVQAMLVFDDAARTKAEELFKSMPSEVRGTWRTVEDMAATLITMSGMEAPFPAADVLEHVEFEDVRSDRARLRLPGLRRDGSEFQHTEQGWTYVITEAMVDDYIRRSREKRNQP